MISPLSKNAKTVDDPSAALASARRTLLSEIQGIRALLDRLEASTFERAIELLLSCNGRVVLTGMGKSGLICRKIAATLTSTGTPSQFLHPAEAIHGDLGVVVTGDVVIAVSYSGETEEVIRLLPAIRRLGVPLICMTGRSESTLAREGEVHIDVSIPTEACPLGLAPTTSTTATLCMGDAIAVALLEARGFSAEDFASCHPGGALGKRLLLRVRDVMHPVEQTPLVREDTSVQHALFEITSKRMGITGVVDRDGNLVGVFSDGDLRRLITDSKDPLAQPIGKVMNSGGLCVGVGVMAVAALKQMEDASITSLFVIDSELSESRPIGIVHLHDLVKAGVA